MKPLPLLLLSALASISSVRSEDAEIAATPATAQVIGEVQDGTPPPAEPPKPGFVVAPEDIISSETHIQDGRKIIVQEISPIALPAPIADQPVSVQANPAVQQRLATLRENAPRVEQLFIGATVFRSQNSPPRTNAIYRPSGGGKPVTFWSSADFSLLTGFSSFLGSDGKTRSLTMMWSARDLDRANQFSAQNPAPQIPNFPEGLATFAVTSENPTPEALAAIQSLHDVYNNEFERLLAAYDSREQARLDREAELKAHPPKPKDITLNFWSTPAPANPSTTGGTGQ